MKIVGSSGIGVCFGASHIVYLQSVCLSFFLSFFFTVKLEHVLAAVEWRPQSKHNSIKLIVAFPIWRAKNVRIFGVKKEAAFAET